MDPAYPLVPIANILASLLLILSFSTNLIRNVAVAIFAAWILLMCLIRAVDSIIWSNNVKDIVPIWCTISQATSICLNDFC